jgi:FkbM family methyltransferase
MIEFTSRLIGQFIARYHKSGARGAARMFAIIAKMINAEPLLLTKTQHNVTIALTPRHYIDTEIIRRGYYEIEVLDAVLEHLEPGNVFWDVGANLGLHSATVKFLRPDSVVVAFEPNPELIVRLLQTMDRNNLTVQVVQSALWNSTTLQGLHLAQSCNPGMTTLLPEDGNNLPMSYISCHLGDELVRQGLVPAPTVIKLDVEGAEGKVLDGLTETLKSRNLHAVIFEHTSTDGTDDVDTPFTRLPLLGFRIQRLNSHHAAKHANYVAIRD